MLEKAYFDPLHPGSFSSPHVLRASLLLKKTNSKRGSKIKVPSLAQIQLWLLEKRPYTLHRPARKVYPMKKVITGGVNIQLQADLIDMQPWSSINDGYRYILLAIDVFSRFAYMRPLKTKHGNSVADSLEDIFDEAESRVDRQIKTLQTDEGKEFYNSHVKEVLEKRHVKLFSTKSPVKAQMVERLIRTLRSRQERLNTYRGTRRWLESFPKLIKSYNHTIHSSLGMPPASVNLKNERQVWEHLYSEDLLRTPTKLKRKELIIGDPVRLSKRKRTFEKAYYQNWTDEIFYIAHISNTNPPIYKLADSEGEILEGVFYREEITPIRFDEKLDYKRRGIGKVYAVEQVLKEEMRKDGKYVFVKWRGFPDSANSWIRADQFMSVRKAT